MDRAGGGEATGRPLSFRIARRLYASGIGAFVGTVLAPWGALRIASGRGHPSELRARMGNGPARPDGASVHIVVHAVSLGEVLASGELIAELSTAMPRLAVSLTTGTRDGVRAAEQLQRSSSAIRQIALIPWDRPPAVRRWLRRLQPDAVVVIETEIWPGLFCACRSFGIPLVLASARIYPRDASRYAAGRFFFRQVLEAATWIAAQSDADAARFLRAGAAADRVEVVGNLKFDASTVPVRDLPESWAASFRAAGPRLVGGSTHPPEERYLLEALQRLRPEFPALRLVLAPRHHRRAGTVAADAARGGFHVARWSRPDDAPARWDVLLVDDPGWLPALYSQATVAFVGGSLAPRGGHNVLEAVTRAEGTLVGPHTRHFEEMVRGLCEAGGLMMTPAGGDPAVELERAVRDLLREPHRRRLLQERAIEYCREHQGVARRCAQRIAAYATGARAPFPA